MKVGDDQHVIDEEIKKYDIRAILIPLSRTASSLIVFLGVTVRRVL